MTVREIISSCLVKLAGEVHKSLVVNIKKLKCGYKRCFPNVVGADEMKGAYEFDLAIIVLSRLQ